MRIKLMLLIIIGLLLLIAVFIVNRSKIDDIVQQGGVQKNLSMSPSPFPSQELTVTFLRNKSYQSRLGELERYADNGTYVSYLTSYDSDGFRVNGLLTLPSGVKPEGGFPAIVFIHGYIAPTVYKTTEKYGDYVDYLARNGYVVFKIDLRGHGSSEGVAGGGYYGSDYIVDTLNAYSALQESGFVNPKRIGLWGHSMAGNVTLRSAVVKPEIPAVVIWGGAGFTYNDLQKYGISDSSYRPPELSSDRQRRRREVFDKYGNFDENHWFWKQVTPVNYLSDFKGAIQLNHAVNDDVVNVGYSRDLNAILEKTSIPHELHEYPSGGHNIEGAAFVTAMQNTVEFFNKYLK